MDDKIFALARSGAVLFGPFTQPIYRITGADAVRYLHGRITQNVKMLAPGFGAKSLVLTPQGRIQGQFLLLREAAGFLLISDPLTEPAALKEALLQFKVADDLVLEDLSAEFKLFVLLGPEGERHLGQMPELAQEAYAHTFSSSLQSLVFRNPYGSFSALGFLVAPDRCEHFIARLAAPLGPEAVLEALRIQAQIPKMEIDLTEKVLAPEIDLADLAAFDKGCYAGQEVVEMATARGRPNRMLVLLEGETNDALRSGDEIFLPGESEKSCGVVTSACLIPGEHRACCLAFLKTALAEEKQYVCRGATFHRVH